MTAIWVIERRLRRKGARWQPWDLQLYGESLSRRRLAEDVLMHNEHDRRCAYRIAKYRRAT